MTDSDDKRSIWIQEQALGTVQTLRHRGREVRYRLPEQIDGQITLRFKGFGKLKNGTAGDLLLSVRVDRGRDVKAVLWLSESQAAHGCQRGLLVGRRLFTITVPPGSREGQVARVAGAGRKTPFAWGLPLFGRRRGDICATLRVFPNTIKPIYGVVESMSDEDLVLESWVYRRIDLVMQEFGPEAFRLPPMTAEDIASLFNEGGWRALAKTLVARLTLEAARLAFASSASLPVPGQCRRSVEKDSSGRVLRCRYEISIRSEFLDDPFAVVAILAHELCHAVYSSRLAPGPDHVSKDGADLWEEERTVDLLVFMFQLGEFQMRVARERNITLGYFNQSLFERMYVILSRKRQVWQPFR